MLVITRNMLREFDIHKAREFINYWYRSHTIASVKYYDSDEVVDYIEGFNKCNLIIGMGMNVDEE